MIMTPKGYQSVKDINRSVTVAVAQTMKESDCRKAEREKLPFSKVLAWQSFAASTYIAQAVQRMDMPIYLLHPKEGVCAMVKGARDHYPPGSEIWGDRLKKGEDDTDLPLAFRDRRWLVALIDLMLSGTGVPEEPLWTTGMTPEKYPVHFKLDDAKRLQETLGAGVRKGPGRPRKQEQCLKTYWKRYPQGHEAERVPWKTAAAACGVSEDTLRRALKTESPAK